MADLCECLAQGFVIDKVNGKPVTTLQEFREALLLSAKTNEIAISTKDKYVTVLDLEKMVLADEVRLARDFKFPLTKTIYKLMESLGITREQLPYNGLTFPQIAAAA